MHTEQKIVNSKPVLTPKLRTKALEDPAPTQAELGRVALRPSFQEPRGSRDPAQGAPRHLFPSAD